MYDSGYIRLLGIKHAKSHRENISSSAGGVGFESRYKFDVVLPRQSS